MRRIRPLLLVLPFLTLFAQAQPLPPAPNPLFDDDGLLPDVYIEMDPGDFAQVLALGPQGSDEEFPARFIFDNGLVRDTVENVGFRMRGNTSRQSQKVSFKVSFNTFEQGGKYRGLEKLNLNGEHNDPSIVRAKLSWDLFREMRVPASRAKHVRLHVNGVYRGLYVHVEHVDEQFLQSRFGEDAGNLYKCLYPADLTYLGDDPRAYAFEFDGRRTYDLKLRDSDEGAYADLARFVDVLNHTPDADFPAAIEEVFDVNGFLRSLAVDVAVGSWDDYWFLMNNYYLYADAATGRFTFIPYDYDNTFGIDFVGGDWGRREVYAWGHPEDPRPLVERLLNVPAYRDRYTFYLRRLVGSLMDPAAYFPRIDALKAQIAAAAEADTFRTLDWDFIDAGAFARSFDEALGGHVPYGLKPYVATRRATALAQLEAVDVPPVLSDARHAPRLPQTGSELRLRVWVEDEEPSALTVTARYRTDGGAEQEAPLFDDGGHGDGAPGDGVYGGSVPAPDAPGDLAYRIVAAQPNGTQSETAERVVPVGYTVPGVVINEFMAGNDSAFADPAGEYDDWIELYNAGSTTVPLEGLYLSDDFARPDKWPLPRKFLRPGEFFLVWADESAEQGALHASFRLDRDGERLGLFNSAETGFAPIDTLTFGPQPSNASFGRVPDGSPSMGLLAAPTPGASNGSGVAASPEAAAGAFALDAPFPNPFRTEASFSFTLAGPARVTAEVFDALGRRVGRLAGGAFPSGTHRLAWTGRDAPPGTYFLRLVVDEADGTTHVHTRPVARVR